MPNVCHEASKAFTFLTFQQFLRVKNNFHNLVPMTLNTTHLRSKGLLCGYNVRMSLKPDLGPLVRYWHTCAELQVSTMISCGEKPKGRESTTKLERWARLIDELDRIDRQIR